MNETIMTEIWHESSKLILLGLWYTTIISLFALVFGTVLGGGLCAMRLSNKKWHNVFVKYFILIVRGVPASMLLMFCFYVVFIGWHPLIVAIIAFILYYATHAADVFKVGYDSVDPHQYIAGLSLGMSKQKAFRYIVLPQMMKNCAPTLKDQAGALIKATSIIGYISITDLTKAIDMIKSESWDPVIPIFLAGGIYLFLVWACGNIIDSLIKRI